MSSKDVPAFMQNITFCTNKYVWKQSKEKKEPVSKTQTVVGNNCSTTLILSCRQMRLVPNQMLRENRFLIRFWVTVMGRRKGKHDWVSPRESRIKIRLFLTQDFPWILKVKCGLNRQILNRQILRNASATSSQKSTQLLVLKGHKKHSKNRKFPAAMHPTPLTKNYGNWLKH